MKRLWPVVLLCMTLLLAGCGARRVHPDPAVLRLGYFANLTHAQAVLGVADGSLQRAAGVKVMPKLFASGPAAITALLA